MTQGRRDTPHDERMARFLCYALNAKSGIDFRVASIALDAYQEIHDMAEAARSRVDEMLGIPEPF